MNSKNFLVVCMLTAIVVGGMLENVEAQDRRRGRNRKVVVVHRPRHTVVVRKAHIRYARMPRWGTTYSVVPSAAVVIRGGSKPYYYHDGVYYAYRNSSYAVVRPARGIRIRVLPIGYRTVVVGPRNYFYYYGTYYSKAASADEYEVVNAPEGAVVDALPDGYEIKTINGTEYYVLDGVYYAEVEDKEFEDGVGYEVVNI